MQENIILNYYALWTAAKLRGMGCD